MASASEQPVTLTVPEGARTISDTIQGKYHLILGLSPEMNAVIEELTLHYRTNKAEVINMAIGLLKHLSDTAREGKHVGVFSDDQELEMEITGL